MLSPPLRSGLEVEPVGDLEIVVFELGGQRFGVLAANVRELLRAVAVVPLPRAPAVVQGVINLRGRVIPVLDVRTRFRIPSKVIEPSDHFIVASIPPHPTLSPAQGEGKLRDRVVALHGDRATDLIRLNRADLEAAQVLVPNAEYVTWVAKVPDNLVLIHDLATFLSHAESAALEEALPGEGA